MKAIHDFPYGFLHHNLKSLFIQTIGVPLRALTIIYDI